MIIMPLGSDTLCFILSCMLLPTQVLPSKQILFYPAISALSSSWSGLLNYRFHCLTRYATFVPLSLLPSHEVSKPAQTFFEQVVYIAANPRADCLTCNAAEMPKQHLNIFVSTTFICVPLFLCRKSAFRATPHSGTNCCAVDLLFRTMQNHYATQDFREFSQFRPRSADLLIDIFSKCSSFI